MKHCAHNTSELGDGHHHRVLTHYSKVKVIDLPVSVMGRIKVMVVHHTAP